MPGSAGVIDPFFPAGVVLSEYRRSPAGGYELAISTRKVFETDVPYPVRLDLPALTARRQALLERAKP